MSDKSPNRWNNNQIDISPLPFDTIWNIVKTWKICNALGNASTLLHIPTHNMPSWVNPGRICAVLYFDLSYSPDMDENKIWVKLHLTFHPFLLIQCEILWKHEKSVTPPPFYISQLITCHPELIQAGFVLSFTLTLVIVLTWTETKYE